jgi:hypothetical protein
MASAPPSITSKDEFINTTDGWLGAVQLNHLGQALGVSVEPGGSVFLTEEEQMLTANAPRDDADNPFVNGGLKLKTRAVEMRNRRPFSEHAGAEVHGETGATPQPEDEPETGSAAVGEEVATPKAAAARRRGG